MLDFLAKWLRNSSHIHQKQRAVETISEMVDLIDRSIDDKQSYPLEWDDFVSWENDNPNIEEVRRRIAALEPLFFSKTQTDRERGVDLVIEERNRAAALVGIKPRQYMYSRESNGEARLGT
jgi:hypothetical protein